MTILIMIFVEITQKTRAARASEHWLLVIGCPIEAIKAIVAIIFLLFTLLSRLLLKLARGAGRLMLPFVTERDLYMLINIAQEERMVDREESGIFEYEDYEIEVTKMRNPKIEPFSKILL